MYPKIAVIKSANNKNCSTKSSFLNKKYKQKDSNASDYKNGIFNGVTNQFW